MRMTKHLLILFLAFVQLTPTDAFAKCPKIAIPFDGVMRCEVERFGQEERLTFKWDMNRCSNPDRLLWSDEGGGGRQGYEHKYTRGEILMDTITNHRSHGVYLMSPFPPLIGYYVDSSNSPASFSASERHGFVANQIFIGSEVTHELVSGQCQFLQGANWTTKLMGPPYQVRSID